MHLKVRRETYGEEGQGKITNHLSHSPGSTVLLTQPPGLKQPPKRAKGLTRQRSNYCKRIQRTESRRKFAVRSALALRLSLLSPSRSNRSCRSRQTDHQHYQVFTPWSAVHAPLLRRCSRISSFIAGLQPLGSVASSNQSLPQGPVCRPSRQGSANFRITREALRLDSRLRRQPSIGSNILYPFGRAQWSPAPSPPTILSRHESRIRSSTSQLGSLDTLFRHPVCLSRIL
jgi:hypothetical protein